MVDVIIALVVGLIYAFGMVVACYRFYKIGFEHGKQSAQPVKKKRTPTRKMAGDYSKGLTQYLGEELDPVEPERGELSNGR